MQNRNARFPHKRSELYMRGNRVEGWLHPFSARAIDALSRYQVDSGVNGAVAEIGIHHGKLFLILYLSTAQDEKALAIDVFSRQHLNIDDSGKGDREVFLRNIDRYAGSREGLEVIEDSSLNVKSRNIFESVGKIRLFSVDGSHTEEATTNDILLAESVVIDDGIVILDDCFNEYWPEVSAAVAKYLYGTGRLVPFAITPGKVMLCYPKMTTTYARALATSFPGDEDKAAHLYGHPVTLFGFKHVTFRQRVGRTAIAMTVKKLLKRR
jgi:hypothetical protein